MIRHCASSSLVGAAGAMQMLELAFQRRDGEWFVLPVASLIRVREIIADLSLSMDAIDVICASDEDSSRLLAQVRGELPIFLH